MMTKNNRIRWGAIVIRSCVAEVIEESMLLIGSLFKSLLVAHISELVD